MLMKLPQIYPFLFFLKCIPWLQSAHIRILLNIWVLWAGLFLLREDISCWTALNSSLEIIASWVFSIIIKSSLEAVFLLVEVTLLVVVLPWTKLPIKWGFSRIHLTDEPFHLDEALLIQATWLGVGISSL